MARGRGTTQRREAGAEAPVGDAGAPDLQVPGGAARSARATRTRRAVLDAVVDLVTERASGVLTVAEVAARAGIGRQLVYQYFAGRDEMVAAAAADLLHRQLETQAHRLGTAGNAQDPRPAVEALARHMAEHRVFYRAVITGPGSFAARDAMRSEFVQLNRALIAARRPDPAWAQLVDDMALFVTAGSGAVIAAWLVDAPDPLDPEAFAARMLRLVAHVTGGTGSTGRG